jgi:hypothetical protein
MEREWQIDKRKTESFSEAARARALVQWTPEARAVARAKALARWTPEARAAHAELMLERMKSPEVRERIRVGTRLGMESSQARQLRRLRQAWRDASVNVRQGFIAELISFGWGQGS